MSFNDAELRFQASLEDNASPQIDALIKKLQKAGASPAEIKMILRTQDLASDRIKDVQKQLNMLPKEHVIRVKAASQEAKTHLEELKASFKEPIEVPIKFTDNLEEVGQRLFTLKSRYAVPMEGLVPGSNMLYGIGAGAGILGAISGMTSMLERSISVNSELEQQQAQLTQALKDSTGATQEMGRILQMASQGQFGRADLTQADIIARQFNLPSFKGESRYMPQGVIPTAENLASVGNTSVTQAAEAIARATQGYYRELIPYGISIRQEDFGAGGRFAGKSPEEAISIATRRFQGAAELQATTFEGMLKRFHNMFEEKIIQPLGVFTFDSFKGQLQSILGGANSGGIQSVISSEMDKAQRGLSSIWNSVQRGRVYFQTNIQKPLTDITKSIIQIGTIFSKVFAGTGVTVLGTFANALVSIARPVTQIVSSVPQIAEFYGVMKALSLLGFKDISEPFTKSVRDLATLRLPSLIGDLARIPAALAKISVFFIAKGFIDAHVAQKAMDDEFPKLHKHFDDLNAKITLMAYNLNESATHMKELVATAAIGLPSGKFSTPQARFDMAQNIARQAAELHNVFGISDTDAVRLITQQMKRDGDYTSKALHEFSDEIAGTTEAAKSMHESFNDVQRVMTQYAASAGPAGLGGLGGAAALTSLDKGIHQIQMTHGQIDQYGTPSGLLRSILSSYAKPSVGDLQALGQQGFASSYDFRAPTSRQFGQFLSTQGALVAQANRARNSSLAAQRQAASLAPDVRIPLVGEPPLGDFTALTGRQYRNIQNDRSNPRALGVDVRQALIDAKQRYADVNNEVQQLTKSVNELANTSATYSQAQSVVNLAVAKFQESILPLQQRLQNMSLATQKYTFDALHPLERQMTVLNQVIAENQHAMSNAQYDMSKWSEGLLVGEQAALNQLHALENYNKQLQLLQNIYQQIGADLGTTVYDQGASVRVDPMSNFSLSMAQQIAARKQQQTQLQYDLGFGEQHYQLEQASRTKFQREELGYNQRLQHIKENVGIIDKTTATQHALENQQFTLSRAMYRVNQNIQDQQDGMTRLQLQISSMEQSPRMQRLARQNAALGVAIGGLGIKAATTQQKLSNYQNVIDNLGQGKQNLFKLLGETLDFTAGGQFDKARKALETAVRKHEITLGQFTDLMIQVAQAQVAFGKGEKVFAQKANQHDWYTVIFQAVKAATVGLVTGRTERDIVNIGQGIASHIPIIGHQLANHTLGALASVGATAYLGISGARGALRLGRAGGVRGGARILEALGLSTGFLRGAARVGRPVANIRMTIDEALRDHGIFGSVKTFGEHGVSKTEKALERIARYADPSRGDLSKIARELHPEPGQEFKDAFRWFKEFREHLFTHVGTAIGAALGTVIGGPGIGTVLGGFFGRRVGKNYAEDHTLRDVGKEGLKAAKSVTNEMKKVHGAGSRIESGAKKFGDHVKSMGITQHDFAKKMGSTADKYDESMKGMRDYFDKRFGHTPHRGPRSTAHDTHEPSVAGEGSKAGGIEGTVKEAGRFRKVLSRIPGLNKILLGASVGPALLAGNPLDAANAGSYFVPGLGEVRMLSDLLGGTHQSDVRGYQSPAAAQAIKQALSANPLQRYISQHPGARNWFPQSAAQSLTNNFMQQAKIASQMQDPNNKMTPEQYQQSLRKLLSLQDDFSTQFEQLTKSHDQTSFQDLQNQHGKVLDQVKKHFTDRVSATQSGLDNTNKTEDQGFGHIYSTVDNWLGKVVNRVKRTKLDLGLSHGHTTSDSTGSASPTSTANAVKNAFARGGLAHATTQELAHHGGRLIKIGEEGPEMIIPLMPHRRQRAKQLLGQTKAIIGYADGGLTPKELNKFNVLDNRLWKLVMARQLFGKNAAKPLDRVSDDALKDHTTITGQPMWADSISPNNSRAINNIEQPMINYSSDMARKFLGQDQSAVKAMLHEWAHWFQSKPLYASNDQNTIEGGAEAFARNSMKLLSKSLVKHRLLFSPFKRYNDGVYTDQVKGVQSRGKNWIMRGQFGMADGGYVNPFQGDTVIPGRVDQGVDYNLGVGNPIRAIGDARISGIKSNWYKGQPFLWYQLLSGARKNQYVYIAEQIANLAKIGSMVHAGDTIARYASSGTGLETGWATASGSVIDPYGGRADGTQTAGGKDFLSFMHSLGVPGGVGKTYAGLASSLSGLHGQGSALLNLPHAPRGLLRSGPVGSMMFGWMKALRGRWNRSLNGSMGPGLGSMGLSGTPAQNAALGRRMAAAMGWTGGEWNALKALWTGESGWNANAVNKSSGAAGIPQALGHGHVFSLGDAGGQIKWGLNYIKHAYGDPKNAYSKWLSRSPHWYHAGSLNVGGFQDNIPAVLQKGEMVLPKQVASSVRGLLGSTTSSNEHKVLVHLEEMANHLAKIEKGIKNLPEALQSKDKTGRNLKDLNDQLRIGYNKEQERISHMQGTGISKLLRGDLSGGEATNALVLSEKAKYQRTVKSTSGTQRAITKHVANLTKSAHSLLHTAHTQHQKRTAEVAVHSTKLATRAVHHMNTFAKHHQGAVRELNKTSSRSRYIVGAAERGVNDRLIKAITGKGLSTKERKDYKAVARHPEDKKAQDKLRADLMKGLSANARHLQALRNEAAKRAHSAQAAVQKAAAAQGKHIDNLGRLSVNHHHENLKARVSVAKAVDAVASKRSEIGHALQKVTASEQKKTVAVSDRADKKRAAEQAANDKRDREHQKKIENYLEQVAKRDMTVNVYNEATGARLSTTIVRTRRRTR